MAGMCTAPPQWPGGRCLRGLAFPLTLPGMHTGTWARAVSPNPGTAKTLSGVAATSAGNAWTWACTTTTTPHPWAVGAFSNATADQALALHCC